MRQIYTLFIVALKNSKDENIESTNILLSIANPYNLISLHQLTSSFANMHQKYRKSSSLRSCLFKKKINFYLESLMMKKKNSLQNICLLKIKTQLVRLKVLEKYPCETGLNINLKKFHLV